MTETEKYYGAIVAGQEVRNNLIELKRVIADPHCRRELAGQLGGDFHTFISLLNHDDPKVRRNAALILGMMETEEPLPFLFDAWEREETLYVRSAYLKAMEGMNIERYADRLKAKERELECSQVETDQVKHVREEFAALHKLLLPYEEKNAHTFTAQTIPEVVLLTRRCVAADTAARITKGQVTEVRGGTIRVKEADVQELMAIRTWQELLLPLPHVAMLTDDIQTLGKALAALYIDTFLNALHQGSGVWRYRLELRRIDKDKPDTRVLQRICGDLDRNSRGRLANTPQNYEVIIRLIERRDGSWVPLLKCMTIKDNRFRYRREFIPDSLSPVTAATVIQLASPWLRERALVWDPFCGAGTLLTERCFYGTVGSAFGTDIYHDAIEKARDNAAHAHLPIHYVQRDFFTFRYEEKFDEVFTDLPREVKNQEGWVISQEDFVLQFLTQLRDLIKEGAVVVIYAREAVPVRRAIEHASRYQIERVSLLNDKSGATVFVLRVKR